MEEPTPYHIGPAAPPESAPSTEKLIALAQANRQGIPYETGERWLEQLPERLCALADLILGGKMQGGDVAYALAVLIDSIENARSAQ
jgi:hypothetical protein